MTECWGQRESQQVRYRSTPEVWRDEARTVLRTLLVEVSNDFSRYELLVIDNATPTAAIKKVVRRLNPDPLVLGTRGRGWPGRTLLGSVANRVIATARCDVFVVPDQTVSATTRNRRLDRRSLDVITGVQVAVPPQSAD